MNESEYKLIRDQIGEQTAKSAKPSRYYSGNHDLAFATAKFTNAFGSLFKAFAVNLCPPVIEAVRDNLELADFTVEDQLSSGDLVAAAWSIWKDGRLALRAGEIHKQALRDGDAFVIVARDARDRVQVYPQSAETCTVVYDPETPGRVMYGAKYWVVADEAKPDEKRIRLTVYYPDRSERFITAKPVSALPERTSEFVEYASDGTPAIVPSNLDQCPVFHFGNNADIGKFGLSELSIVTPVQDAFNKSICDMLVAMEFAAFRQRWVAGLELELDGDGKPIPPFRSGIDRIWTVDTPDTKFGDFASTDLKQFLEVKNSFRLDVAMVSGTPLHYFMPVGAEFPSGEAMKKAETRFHKKVKNRQEAFGAIWEDIMAYALKLDGKGDARIFASFRSPAELSDGEHLDNLAKKQDLGVPDEQLWSEAGYGAEDVARFAAAKAEEAQRAADRFNEGLLPQV